MAILNSPQQQQNRPQQAGTGFTNLQNVLSANKNNQLGATVAGGVQQAGQAARGALNTAGQEFQTGLGQEKQRLDSAGQEVSSVMGNIPGATDQQVKDFEGIRAGQYNGPTGLNNTNELQSKASEAQSLGNAGGSEAGRFGLLQRFVGRGQQYTGGQQRMDNLLLGQQGGQQLQQARAGTVGLSGQVDRGIQGAQAQGQEGQAQARGLATNTINQLGSSVSDYDKAMQQQLATKQGAINQFLTGLGGQGTNAAVELDPARLAQLKEASGGVLDAGTQLFNTDISPFVQANTLFATKQGAQSDSDFAKAQMLGRLSGNSLNGQDAGNTLQDYLGRADQVGAYDKNNPFSVTSNADLAAAIAKQKADYDSQTAAQNAAISAAQGQLGGRFGSDFQSAMNSGINKGFAGDEGLYGRLAIPFHDRSLNGTPLDSNIATPTDIQGLESFAQGFGSQNAQQRNVLDLLNQARAQESNISNAQAQKQALDQQFNVLRSLKAKQAIQSNPTVDSQGNPVVT